jgi:hypothetical protein
VIKSENAQKAKQIEELNKKLLELQEQVETEQNIT